MKEKYIPKVGDFVFGPKNTWWFVDEVDEDGHCWLIGDDGEDADADPENLEWRGENYVRQG